MSEFLHVENRRGQLGRLPLSRVKFIYAPEQANWYGQDHTADFHIVEDLDGQMYRLIEGPDLPWSEEDE